jgi:hypothetical protein
MLGERVLDWRGGSMLGKALFCLNCMSQTEATLSQTTFAIPGYTKWMLQAEKAEYIMSLPCSVLRGAMSSWGA